MRAKHLLRVIDERAGSSDLQLLSVSIHHGVVPRDSLTEDEPRADDFSNYKVCRTDDIVVNRMRAFQGGVGIAPQTGIVSPDYLVLRTARGLEARFFHYLFRSTWFVGEMTARLRGIGGVDQGNVRTPRINAEDLGDIRVALPSPPEQRQIVDYLDTETARITSLIEKKRRMIEVLNERWRAAATHRIALLCEEMGTIPLRRVTRCLDRLRVPLSAEERATRQGPYPYYGASAVVDMIDDYLFDEDLVLVGEDGAQLGDPAYPIAQRVTGKVWVNNHAHVLRPLEVDPDLLVFLLNTFDRIPFISGATREKLTQDDLGQIRVPAGSLHAQASVAAELVAERARCDQLARMISRQIDLLAEHRQALITAAVTGELELSGHA